jgi:hypothetical protein
VKLPVERSHPLGQFVVEFFKILRESPQFDRIDDGLGHTRPRLVLPGSSKAVRPAPLAFPAYSQL